MLKISVVEDKDDIRKSLIRNINKSEGLICISEYDSAETALEGLPIDRPNLVIMDIGLPKMTGVECMIRLSLKETEIDYLMFTVFDHDHHVFDALKAGASGYILKGEGTIGALKAIKEYMSGGAPMSRSIAKKILSSFQSKKNNNETVFDILTKQQKNILEHLAEGLLNKEIADRLGISERTVKQHNNAIYKKLQVYNRTEAVRKYLDATL